MKIGIYGDSFAVAKQQKQHDQSWFEYIGEQGHDVTTFGKNAGSLFHSMKQFLKTQHIFDLNIFVITSPHRFIIPQHFDELPHYLGILYIPWKHPFNEFIISRTPAARWGEPEDLQGAAIFLSSKASDFVNGHILYVDGGILATIGKPSNEI